jgi:hypothetical protein
MKNKSFKLLARVSSSNPHAIKPVLERLINKGSVREEENDEFIVEATMEGSSAKELNRSLLSELRRVEKKTRLRAAWTFNNTTEKYFDYVLKKTEKVADKTSEE